MRLSILTVSGRCWAMAALALTLILATNLVAQNTSPSALLKFVPPGEQQKFFVPQQDPTIPAADAVEKALSDGGMGAPLKRLRRLCSFTCTIQALILHSMTGSRGQ